MNHILWHEITTADDACCAQALALYDATFPLEVREPHDVFYRSLALKKKIGPSAFHFLVGLTQPEAAQTKQVVAMAILHYLAEVNWGFLVYVLVDPNWRGQGVGQELHAHIERVLQADAKMAHDKPLRGILLETEQAEQMQTAEELADSRRRTRFFTQLGYRQVEKARYLQPPLHGHNAAVPLHLFQKLNTEPLSLSTAELRRVVQAVYREKYGQMNQIAADVLQACEQRFHVDPE